MTGPTCSPRTEPQPLLFPPRTQCWCLASWNCAWMSWPLVHSLDNLLLTSGRRALFLFSSSGFHHLFSFLFECPVTVLSTDPGASKPVICVHPGSSGPSMWWCTWNQPSRPLLPRFPRALLGPVLPLLPTLAQEQALSNGSLPQGWSQSFRRDFSVSLPAGVTPTPTASTSFSGFPSAPPLLLAFMSCFQVPY